MTIIRRDLTPRDVLVNILYCGICHSDYHHIKNDWCDSKYPMVLGHEIICTVANTGNLVTKIQLRDTVSIANMIDSCRICKMCTSGH